VAIHIFDDQGRVVRLVRNQDMPAGTHTVDVDLEDLPAGVYHCRLQNGRRQQVKDLLKVR